LAEEAALIKNDYTTKLDQSDARTDIKITGQSAEIILQLDSTEESTRNQLKNQEKHQQIVTGNFECIIPIDYINEQKLKRKRDKTDIFQEMGRLNTNLKEANKVIKRHSSEIYNTSQILKVLIEVEQISQSLQIQDEEDRHSIALWGMNKPTKFDNSVIRETNQSEDSPDRMNATNITPNRSFLNSSNDFPLPSATKHVDLQTPSRALDLKMSPTKNEVKQNLETLTQRSTNFAITSNRKAKSVNRRALNPIHYKRSLPQV
jgi:hypothetical protein